MYPQLKAVYGRIDSPRLFTTEFKQAAGKHGWSELAESLLVRRDSGGACVGVLLMHMDDLLSFADDAPASLHELGVATLRDVAGKGQGLGFIVDGEDRSHQLLVFPGLPKRQREQETACRKIGGELAEVFAIEL